MSSVREEEYAEDPASKCKLFAEHFAGREGELCSGCLKLGVRCLGGACMTRVLLTIISSAKVPAGVGSIVFHAAVGGAYNNQTGTHQSSIYYVGNDLHVNVLFDRWGKAAEIIIIS